MDIKEMLKQQLKATDPDNRGGNTNDFPTRKNKAIVVNGNNPFLGRILPTPIGTNGWFAKQVVQVWVTAKRSDGSTFNYPVIVDPRDNDDDFVSTIKSIMAFNKKYSKEHKEYEDTNFIQVSHSTYNGKPVGQTGFRTSYEVIGIPSVPDQNGTYIDAHTATDYMYQNLIIRETAYRSILEALADDSLRVSGKPFADDLKFISTGTTVPIEIKRTGNNYSSNVREGLVLPAMSQQINPFEKDSEGHFTKFDDPEYFNRLTREVSPSFYDTLTNQVKKIAHDKMGTITSGANVTNPYSQPSAQAPSTQGGNQPSNGGTSDAVTTALQMITSGKLPVDTAKIVYATNPQVMQAISAYEGSTSNKVSQTGNRPWQTAVENDGVPTEKAPSAPQTQNAPVSDPFSQSGTSTSTAPSNSSEAPTDPFMDNKVEQGSTDDSFGDIFDGSTPVGKGVDDPFSGSEDGDDPFDTSDTDVQDFLDDNK